MEALRAADAAIIVASAKDGVSVGVEKAGKYCEERNMPRFIYISKIDEDHSDYNATFDALRERFGNQDRSRCGAYAGRKQEGHRPHGHPE